MHDNAPMTGAGRLPKNVYPLALGAALVAFLVALPALRGGFLLWDDGLTVVNNVHIRRLDASFFSWASTSTAFDLWQPVTWTVYALDYAFWGLNPVGYHLTNILLHAANTFLVTVLAMRLLTVARVEDGERPAAQAAVPAALAGVLFGIHPIHVESVAWITGRVDLVCGVFFFLSISAYVEYAKSDGGPPKGRRPAFRDWRYLSAFGMFLLAVASKPTAVVLPLVFAALDWYPLRRAEERKNLLPLLWEKLPFLMVSILVSAALLIARSSSVTSGVTPAGTRLLVGLKGFVLYLWKMAFPFGLLSFYPYPESASVFSPEFFPWLAGLGLLLAAGIVLRKKFPAVPAAGLYYLVTLLPASGIVKVREAAMADRYAYLPSAGPFVLVALFFAHLWLSPELFRLSRRAARKMLVPAAALAFAGLAFLTQRQTAVWNNSISLWSHVIEEEPVRVPMAYNQRGLAYREKGAVDLALRDLDAAIRLKPEFAHAYAGRGWIYLDLGRLDLALDDLNAAIRLDPSHAIAFNNRGMLYQKIGRPDLAVNDFTSAVDLDSSFAQAYTNRGLAYEEMGQAPRALDDYTLAIQADPSFASAYNDRGLLFEKAGRFDQAMSDLDAAIRLNPGFAEAYNNRGLVRERMSSLDEAVADYSRAIVINPDNPTAYANRGVAFAKMQRHEEAVKDYRKACDGGIAFACEAMRGYGQR